MLLTPADIRKLEKYIFREINDLRVEYGYDPLRFNNGRTTEERGLNNAAAQNNQWVASRATFESGHEPNLTGRTRDSGLSYVAENNVVIPTSDVRKIGIRAGQSNELLKRNLKVAGKSPDAHLKNLARVAVRGGQYVNGHRQIGFEGSSGHRKNMLAPSMTHGAVQILQRGDSISITFIAASKGKRLFPTGYTIPSIKRELVPEDSWLQKKVKKAQNFARSLREPNYSLTTKEKTKLTADIKQAIYDKFQEFGIERDAALEKATRNKVSGTILTGLNSSKYKHPGFKGGSLTRALGVVRDEKQLTQLIETIKGSNAPSHSLKSNINAVGVNIYLEEQNDNIKVKINTVWANNSKRPNREVPEVVPNEGRDRKGKPNAAAAQNISGKRSAKAVKTSAKPTVASGTEIKRKQVKRSAPQTAQSNQARLPVISDKQDRGVVAGGGNDSNLNAKNPTKRKAKKPKPIGNLPVTSVKGRTTAANRVQKTETARTSSNARKTSTSSSSSKRQKHRSNNSSGVSKKGGYNR